MYSDRLEYKYWGVWGPAPSRKHLLSGALTFFVVLPILALLVVALVVLLLIAIAVPPVGVALIARNS